MHKLKILIVDDDPDIAGAFTHILQSADYDAISAATGQECLQIARAERPDLILLDVRLPDINGLEVCRRIKTQSLRGSRSSAAPACGLLKWYRFITPNC